MHTALPETALVFTATCLIVELTPGPNMAYLAILSASFGRKAGFFATSGVAAGLLIIGIASALGLSEIIINSALAYQILRWSGTAYLLWLAWDTARFEDTIPSGAMDKQRPASEFFRRGLFTNLFNPKAAIFYVAILPRFIDNTSHITAQAVFLTLLYVIVATVIHTTIVCLSGSARRLLQNEKQRMFTRRCLAFLLALIALWLLWTT